MFLRGKKYIFDEPYSEQDFWDELKKIIFGLKEPRPTFRQLIPKFVRVENTAEERMIKFLPIMTGSDVYDTIYCFLFQIYIPLFLLSSLNLFVIISISYCFTNS